MSKVVLAIGIAVLVPLMGCRQVDLAGSWSGDGNCSLGKEWGEEWGWVADFEFERGGGHSYDGAGEYVVESFNDTASAGYFEPTYMRVRYWVDLNAEVNGGASGGTVEVEADKADCDALIEPSDLGQEFDCMENSPITLSYVFKDKETLTDNAEHCDGGMERD